MIEWREVRGVRVAVIENVLVVDLPGPRTGRVKLAPARGGGRQDGGAPRGRVAAQGNGKRTSGRTVSLDDPKAFGPPGRRRGNRTRRPVNEVLKRRPEDLDEL